MPLRGDRFTRSTHTQVWQCESDLNRHLLDRQSSALPLSYRTGNGRRLLPAACRMSFTRRLLDGKSGHRLHANPPTFCTNVLACETHTSALSVISHDSRCIALPLSPQDEDSGDRTCLERQAVVQYVGGRRERAQPGLNAAVLPLKVSAPTSTQSTLLKSCSGHRRSRTSLCFAA